MEEKKGVSPPTNIGIALLLVVFLILCLFTFSAIALVQAGNEGKNSKITADTRTAYYTALNSAELSLHQKNLQLKKTGLAGAKRVIAESYPINKTSDLKVTFTLIASGGRPRYIITGQKSVPSTEWNGDDSVNIIQ